MAAIPSTAAACIVSPWGARKGTGSSNRMFFTLALSLVNAWAPSLASHAVPAHEVLAGQCEGGVGLQINVGNGGFLMKAE